MRISSSFVPTESAFNPVDANAQTRYDATAPAAIIADATEVHSNQIALSQIGNLTKSLFQSDMLDLNSKSLVLEYLNRSDQLALTSTCRGWNSRRSDTTPWKSNLKLVINPKTNPELFQSIENLQFDSDSALNVPLVLDLSKLTSADTILLNLLSALYSTSNKIESLILNISEISTQGFDVCHHLPKLSKLKITSSNVSSLKSLAGCELMRSLATLDLSRNIIESEAAQAIAGSEYLRSLTTLNVSYNRIGIVGAQAIAGSEYLRALTTLDLMRNDIGNIGAQAIAGSEHLRSLTTLDLSGNSIGPEGAQAIAGSEHLRALTTLRLGMNIMGDVGTQAIAGSEHLRALTTLDLSWNNIGLLGAQELVESINVISLTALDLSYNRTGDAVAQTIAASQYLRTLRTLRMKLNDIGNAGARAIANSKNLRSLTALDLSNNHIGPAEQEALRLKYLR